MNDPFVERSEKAKKVSGTMLIETRSQKAPEDERAKLDEKIFHPNPALDENRVGCGTEGKENSRLRSVFIPVEQGLVRTVFLDREEMSELSDLATENPADGGSPTENNMMHGLTEKTASSSSFSERVKNNSRKIFPVYYGNGNR